MSKSQSLSEPKARGPGRPSSADRFAIPDELHKALSDIDFFRNSGSAEELAASLPDASSYTFLDRFRATVRRLMSLTGGNTDSFVSIVGKSWKTVERYLDGATPNSATVATLCAAASVPVAWLMVGTAQRNASAGPMKGRRERVSSSTFLSQFVDDFTLVPRYNVAASAGPGSLAMSEEVSEMMAFRRDWLRRINVNPAAVGLITSDGDSMAPTIPDKSLMLIDLSEKQLRHGGIFVIVRYDVLIVKRVELLKKKVALISDNPMYEREDIAPEEISDLHIAGRVKWVGHSI